MPLPAKLYDVYVDLRDSALVKGTVSDESIAEFNDILNQSVPVTDEEYTEKNLIRMMYAGNPKAFSSYLYNNKNRVRPAILYTEGREIVNHFGLMKVIFIRWDNENSKFLVERFVPRTTLTEPSSEENRTEHTSRGRYGGNNEEHGRYGGRGRRGGRGNYGSGRGGYVRNTRDTDQQTEFVRPKTPVKQLVDKMLDNTEEVN